MIITGGVFGAPPAEEAPPPLQPTPPAYSEPLRWLWYWWNGQDWDRWDLTDLASPVVKLRGATGTGQVDPEHWWTDSPTIDGSSHGGLRIGRGSLFLPLRVQGSDTTDFLVKHEDFMRTLDPRQDGWLRVVRPDGTWRQTACRYESGADAPINLDPVAMHHATYGITWATADPYWRGETASFLFEYADPTPFFPGPPFTLVTGRSLSNSTTTNPGDVEAYPVWRVNGPFTGFSVGVGPATVGVGMTKTAGQWIEIDMNPRKLTVLDEAGVDRWDNISAAEFEAIPPGREVDVVTQVFNGAAGTSVSLEFTPRYRRAW